jgi:hypothetical protein
MAELGKCDREQAGQVAMLIFSAGKSAGLR